jgi:hypothetical protein
LTVQHSDELVSVAAIEIFPESICATYDAHYVEFAHMALDRTLSSQEIREVGETLFGLAWQIEMARAIGVPRQSIGYYLRAGGVSGAQAAAIVGLVARTAAREQISAREQQAALDARLDELSSLLHRFDARIWPAVSD